MKKSINKILLYSSKSCQFIFLCIVLLQTIPLFAQTKLCDIRLNVFLAKDDEYPLSSPIKNAGATIVNLSDNKIAVAQLIEDNLLFSNLSQGEYNIVVSKNGYMESSKTLRLDCSIVDEKDAFDEFIFMKKGDVNQSFKINPVSIDIEDSIKPPAPRGGYPKGFKYPEKSLVSYFLNERAIFLPQPKLTDEGNKFKEYYKSVQGNFFAKVYVTVDETGKVTDSSYPMDSIFDAKLFPDILEKAKQAKFVPFKVNGKLLPFSGVIVYTF